MTDKQWENEELHLIIGQYFPECLDISLSMLTATFPGEPGLADVY